MSENNADTLTSEFWENIERKKLVRPVCNLCGNNFFSPQVVCPDCQSSDWIYEESNGNGKIYSYTVIHRPMGDGFPNPYIVVDVDLEEGWKMYSQLLNCEIDEISVGLEVEVIFEKHAERTMPFFQPRRAKK
ncbi:MAG: hypothetical protein CL455_07125 [Acidimicrobiaceae bacterium]|nr:hypothetical protein [Acidimicrobiaceae bacterium]MEC7845409.1 OB-fold domain-containing protein [Actinomycetota bacterium]MED5230630.1 OB-fold domain-containing protein [Actinomycetota bacterium]